MHTYLCAVAAGPCSTGGVHTSLTSGSTARGFGNERWTRRLCSTACGSSGLAIEAASEPVAFHDDCLLQFFDQGRQWSTMFFFLRRWWLALANKNSLGRPVKIKSLGRPNNTKSWPQVGKLLEKLAPPWKHSKFFKKLAPHRKCSPCGPDPHFLFQGGVHKIDHLVLVR